MDGSASINGSKASSIRAGPNTHTWTYGEARFLFYPPEISWNLRSTSGRPSSMEAGLRRLRLVALTASGCSMFLLARRYQPGRCHLRCSSLRGKSILRGGGVLAKRPGRTTGRLSVPTSAHYSARHERGRRIVVPFSLVVAAAWLTNAPAAMMVNYSLALLTGGDHVRQPKFDPVRRGRRSWAPPGRFLSHSRSDEEKWVNIDEVLAPGFRPQDNFLFTTDQRRRPQSLQPADIDGGSV